MMPRIQSGVAALAVLLLAITPAFAAQTVKVMLEGEGGGKMSIKLDHDTVKAGPVNFEVKNDAMGETHEFVVVRLKSKDQPLPYDATKDRVDEKKLKSLGEIADLAPGKSGKLSVKLRPGSYVLLCNIKGHYNSGMVTRLTVVD